MYVIPKHLLKKYSKLASNGTNLATKQQNVAAGIGLASTVAAIGAETINPYTDIDTTNPYAGQRMDANKAMGKDALKYGAAGATAGMAFGPWVAAVGGAVGAGYGAISGASSAKQFNAQQVTMEREYDEQLLEQDRYRLATHREGISRNSLYAATGANLSGNQFDIPSKNSEQVSSDAEKVVNAGTHESGNDVDVTDQNGDIASIVEEGELIIGDMVFSARNGYAAKAENLSTIKSNYEKIIDESTDAVEVNTINREIVKVDKSILDLFNIQETSKPDGQPKLSDSTIF